MITFFDKDKLLKLTNEQEISRWVLNTFKNENYNKEILLNIIFCSDKSLLKLNNDFLQHDYYTDIITFVIEESEEHLESELYISIDRIKDNAKKLNVSFEVELHRVIIHGVLHLCGYKDKTKEEILTMRSKEAHYLSMI